ncbi:hypothetical protein PLANTIT3_60315 [Plantibacter sp. T3]|nr:hypothetical protein PLANTIT3_60315 [Plantibacter sp. T3]
MRRRAMGERGRHPAGRARCARNRVPARPGGRVQDCHVDGQRPGPRLLDRRPARRPVRPRTGTVDRRRRRADRPADPRLIRPVRDRGRYRFRR